MRNCIITGSGRSGTSMMAGMLARSGYYLGDDHLPARPANPKGYFEDSIVNEVNTAILHRKLRQGGVSGKLPPGWLVSIPAEEPIDLPLTDAETALIEERVSQQPFCYKDPRFSYTFPLWEPLLPSDTRVIVMFRDPLKTAKSILRHNQETGVARELPMSLGDAVTLWTVQYQRLLRQAQATWFIVHYDSVLYGSAWAGLSQFLNADLDTSFPDPDISRSQANVHCHCPPSVSRTYKQLLSAEARACVPHRSPFVTHRVSTNYW